MLLLLATTNFPLYRQESGSTQGKLGWKIEFRGNFKF